MIYRDYIGYIVRICWVHIFRWGRVYFVCSIDYFFYLIAVAYLFWWLVLPKDIIFCSPYPKVHLFELVPSWCRFFGEWICVCCLWKAGIRLCLKLEIAVSCWGFQWGSDFLFRIEGFCLILWGGWSSGCIFIGTIAVTYLGVLLFTLVCCLGLRWVTRHIFWHLWCVGGHTYSIITGILPLIGSCCGQSVATVLLLNVWGWWIRFCWLIWLFYCWDLGWIAA